MSEPTSDQIRSMQRKLDKIAKLSAELNTEAKEAYGSDAFVFVEAEGGIYVMDGDACPYTGSTSERQEHVRLAAKPMHFLRAGAW